MVVRLSILYIGIFALIGTMLPYWPVWLESRGLGAWEIGVISGAAMWSKLLINPLGGLAADVLGHRRPVMAALAATSLLLFLVMVLGGADSFWLIFALAMPATGLFAGLLPLAETTTLRLSTDHGFSYGRVRLWGSISFIAFVTLVGPAVDLVGPGVVPWVIMASLVLILAWLPRVPDPPAAQRGARDGLKQLVRQPGFVLFLAAVGLIQAGHATYYGFATLHWRAAGLDGVTVGLLWAEGVVAEILLFWFSRPLVGRLGPLTLAGLAALCGVLRWLVTAQTTDPAVLAITQVLHAGTYGCAHLAAMRYLADRIPEALAASAQALYSSICMGIVIGLAMTLAGPLYGALGGGAFAMDAVYCALGAWLLWRLARRERRGRGSGQAASSSLERLELT